MSESTSSAGHKRLIVYAINEKEGERAAWWQRIGTAYTNRDGSINIVLDALPLGTNRLQVREQRDEVRPGGAAQNGASQNGARRGGLEEVRP